MRNRGKREGEKAKTLWKQKTLHDYYDILVAQPEMEAKELALSEFVALLRQAPTDLEKLSEVINISPEQLKFVRGAQSGTGILKHGNMVVPMDITVDKDSPVYKLFSTNPFEEGKEAACEEGQMTRRCCLQ